MISKNAAAQIHEYLHEYAKQKGIYLKINFVNADHVHALVDLPTSLSIEDMMQLFKGSSSHWINQRELVPGKFVWGRGYGAFSVSQSNVEEVSAYIANQEEHHRVKTFAEEYESFVSRYGLQYSKED